MREDDLSPTAILDTLRLIFPNSADFNVGANQTNTEAARSWAWQNQYYLAKDVARCAHGLYGLAICPDNNCRHAMPQLDHAQVWVPQISDASPRATPFVLAHAYINDPTDPGVEVLSYARAHALNLMTSPPVKTPDDARDWVSDAWYGHGTTAIRLSVPSGWPMWPIERSSILLQAAQPRVWPPLQ